MIKVGMLPQREKDLISGRKGFAHVYGLTQRGFLHLPYHEYTPMTDVLTYPLSVR